MTAAPPPPGSSGSPGTSGPAFPDPLSTSSTRGAGPGGDVGTRPAPSAPAKHTGRTIGRTLALALLIFVVVVLVLFVVFNTQSVDISLVFADVNAPLVLALVIAAALGGLVVGLAGAARRARHNRRS